MLEWFAPTGRPIHCILTKADKLNRSECTDALRKAKAVLDSYVDDEGPLFPFSLQLFSALKRIGIEEADAAVQRLVGLDIDPAAHADGADTTDTTTDQQTGAE